MCQIHIVTIILINKFKQKQKFQEIIGRPLLLFGSLFKQILIKMSINVMHLIVMKIHYFKHKVIVSPNTNIPILEPVTQYFKFQIFKPIILTVRLLLFQRFPWEVMVKDGQLYIVT